MYDMVQQRFGKLNAFHDLVRDLPMASDTSWVLPSSETTKRFSLIGRVYNTSNWYTNRHIMLAVVDPYVIQAKNRDSRLYRTSQGKYKHTLEEFSYDPPSDTGIIVDSVIIFGKFQAVRGMQTQLTDVKIDSIPGYNSDPLTYLANCSVIPHLDGKFNDRVVTLISTTDYYEDLASVEYQSHEWAKSHSVVVQGGFDVTSIELTTHIDGVYR